MYQSENLGPEMRQAGASDRPAYEVRVDGIAVARASKIEEMLRIALDRKRRLPQQIVSLHELKFGRAWTVDVYGRVVSVTP